MGGVLFLVALLTIVSSAQGQRLRAGLCETFDKLIVQPLDPETVNRKIFFSDLCDFEFRLGENKRVSFSVEKYISARKAGRALASDLNSFIAGDSLESTPKHEIVPINADGYWSEAVAYRSKYPDHFVLLRKGKFKVTILSPDFGTLLLIERELRKISFHG
jgi:hypothetical protein